MTQLLRMPALPEHDPKVDGNVFAWIVHTAPKVREQRQQVHDAARSAQRLISRLQSRSIK
jgi:hypothetical protein